MLTLCWVCVCEFTISESSAESSKLILIAILISKWVLVCKEIHFHGTAVALIRLITTVFSFRLAVTVIQVHPMDELKTLVFLLEEVSVRFRVLAVSFIFHFNILLAKVLALLGFLVFPLLGQSVRELFVD